MQIVIVIVYALILTHAPRMRSDMSQGWYPNGRSMILTHAPRMRSDSKD